jgi:hypothetical protein
VVNTVILDGIQYGSQAVDGQVVDAGTSYQGWASRAGQIPRQQGPIGCGSDLRVMSYQQQANPAM